MSIEQVQQKMEMLRLNHTSGLLSELLNEATKSKVTALEFLEKVVSLEVQALLITTVFQQCFTVIN